MTLGPSLRKVVLSVHIALSVGWMGAVMAYLALDVTTATSGDATALRAAYWGMDLIVRTVVVPLAGGALLTGLAISLGTKWGLVRHWWTVISLLLTVFATLVLLVETRIVSELAAAAADPTTSTRELQALGSTLVHSAGGAIVLLVILVLNVHKPQGLTPYGWRKLTE